MPPSLWAPVSNMVMGSGSRNDGQWQEIGCFLPPKNYSKGESTSPAFLDNGRFMGLVAILAS